MNSSPGKFYVCILAYKREVGGARTFDLVSHNKTTFFVIPMPRKLRTLKFV